VLLLLLLLQLLLLPRRLRLLPPLTLDESLATEPNS
jgi:hypothetical protein